MFVTTIVAVLVSAVPKRVLASETSVFVSGQGFEVALPGTGSQFAPVPQGTYPAEGSKVRTGKAGWATLRLGNDTQVELRADSEVAFSNAFRSDEVSKAGSTANEGNRADGASAFHAGDSFPVTAGRGTSAARLPDAGPLVVEVELRHGSLGVLADGTTELRVWFANSVTMAKHARFAVKADQGDRARVIVERGTARVFVSDDKKELSPVAGQCVEINKQATGHVVTAVQSVRSNDAEAVAEMAALRFVPTLVEPATKPASTAADSSTAVPPITTTSTTAATAANGPPASQAASTTLPAPLPPTSLPPASDHSATVQPGVVVTTTSYGAAPLGSLANVDPLQAPANGANIKGPVTSPEHP